MEHLARVGSPGGTRDASPSRDDLPPPQRVAVRRNGRMLLARRLRRARALVAQRLSSVAREHPFGRRAAALDVDGHRGRAPARRQRRRRPGGRPRRPRQRAVALDRVRRRQRLCRLVVLPPERVRARVARPLVRRRGVLASVRARQPRLRTGPLRLRGGPLRGGAPRHAMNTVRSRAHSSRTRRTRLRWSRAHRRACTESAVARPLLVWRP